jgi:ankyrin repeat protein
MLENRFLDINRKDKFGLNSFWIACMYGHGGVMKVLAENGIDVFVTNEKLYNVLHLAAKKNYINIVKMLIKSKFPLDDLTSEGLTAVCLGAKKGHTSVVKALNKAGADINLTDPEGIGPLYLSILNNHQKCSEYLIENGA